MRRETERHFGEVDSVARSHSGAVYRYRGRRRARSRIPGGGKIYEAVASAPAPIVIPVESTPVETGPTECAVQFNRSLTNSLAEGDPVQIDVFGDSFGDGLWAAL